MDLHSEIKAEIRKIVGKTDLDSLKKFAELIGVDAYFCGHTNMDIKIECSLHEAYLAGKKRAKEHTKNLQEGTI